MSGTTPPTVNAGQSARLTICTNGTVDLGNLTIGQFGIRPSAFASNYKILNQFATAMLFDVDIAPSAKTGRWTLFVNDASGREALALDIFIAGFTPPPPAVCTATTCSDVQKCCIIAGQRPFCCPLTDICGVENGLSTCKKVIPQ
jgi:hypothetical protein